MPHKFWLLIKSAACLIAAASALAITAAPGAEKVVIGLSQPNLGWPYIAAYTKAFQEGAAKKGNVDVIVLSGDGDIAKQSRDMDSLIAKKVNIILVCSLDGNAIVPSIKAAHDANIPVLAVSNEPASSANDSLAGYSGPDDYVQGKIAAELLNDALGGQGNIVIIEGTPGQSTTAARTKGLMDRLAELKSKIQVLGKQTANWDPVQAKAVMEDFLTTHGDEINGVFSQDDNTASAAAEVIKAAGKLPAIKVVGTGGSKNGIQAIQDGLVYGTMNQSPSADAQQGLEIALGIVGGKPPAEKRTIIPMPKITSANVDQFQGEW
jgi:ribose transport system substrate-binding protein